MEREILQQFTQLYNNQDLLSNLINSGLNSRYSNSELHCIEWSAARFASLYDPRCSY